MTENGPSARPLVLCVDDEAPILGALQRLLRHEPYDLKVTTDPKEALRLIRENKISVVVADQRMPDMTGCELLERVLVESPRTGRILLTGFADTTVSTRSGQLVIDVMIIKPWEDDELKRFIRSLVNREPPTQAETA